MEAINNEFMLYKTKNTTPIPITAPVDKRNRWKFKVLQNHISELVVCLFKTVLEIFE